MGTTGHPELGAILAGGDEVAAHVDGCALCRQLAALCDRGAAAELLAPVTVDPALFGARESLEGGQGGMGRTQRAWDRRLGRDVVIKEAAVSADLPPALRDALRARLVHEARVTARLEHPGIVAVHELGTWPDGEPFYTMPVVSGTPLDRAIGRCATLRDRLALVPRVAAAADALAYAHARGVVHRDVKPANIMLGEFGETVVIDWGLAKRIGDPVEPAVTTPPPPRDGLTAFGAGTVQYMPPEQARGDEPDARVDVYALGATLYHVLAGLPPYGTGDGVRDRLLAGPPRSLAELAPEIPPELAAICGKAMAREPAARYASAIELANDLRAVLTGGLASAHRYRPGEVLRLWLRRHRAAVRVASAAFAVLLAGGVLAVRSVLRARDRADREARAATSALATSQAARATLLAQTGATRLEALELALAAAAPALAAGTPLPPEVHQGLIDAIAAGPFAVALPGDPSASVLAYSPAGDRFATFSGGAIQIWDARTGALSATHATAFEPVVQAEFSPDGAQLAIATTGSAVELWRGDTAARLSAGAGQAMFAFAADGTLVIAGAGSVLAGGTTAPLPCTASRVAAFERTAIVGCSDGSLWTWPIGGRLERLGAHGGAVTGIAGATGTVWTSGLDGTVLAWEAAALAGGARAPRTSWSDPTRPIHGLRVSPDGRWLAIAAGVWTALDPTTGTARVIANGIEPGDAPWPPGAPRVFGASEDGPVALDVATGTVLGLLRGQRHANRWRLAGSPDGTRVVAASERGEAWLWDARFGEASGLLPEHAAEVVAIAAGASGIRTLAVDGSLRVTAGARLAAASAAGTELAVAAADGDVLVGGGADGVMRLWRGDAPPEERRLDARGITAVAIARDRVAAGDAAGHVAIWRGDTVERFDARGPVAAVALGPALVVVASRDAVTVRRDGGAPVVLEGGGETAIASRDGESFAIGRGERIQIYAARTLAATTSLAGRALAWTPHGLVLADAAGNVSVWTSGAARVLGSHGLPITSAAASADGAWLVTGDTAGALRVWDLARGALAFSIGDGDRGAVTALALTADAVLAGHTDGQVRTYPLTVPAARRRACTALAAFGRRVEGACP